MKKEELNALLQDMPLEEKVNQMLQIVGFIYLQNDSDILTGPARNMGLTKDNVDLAGSILGTFGADNLIKIQKNQMEKQPHHIPMLFMMDVIHGMKTIFPIPLGQGATFEPELSEKCAYKPLEFVTSVSKTEQWIDGEILERIGEKNM